MSEGAIHKRKMKNLLLNRRFQLKYTAMVVGVASLVSVVLGMFLVSTVRENSRMLQLDAEFDAALQSQLGESDARMILVLVLAFVIFNLVLAIGAVLITHRMVGPVFVVRRYVQEIGEGRLPRLRKLRPGDEFVDLVDSVAQAIRALEARTRSEVQVYERVLSALPEGGTSGPARAELEAILSGKREVLARYEAQAGVE